MNSDNHARRARLPLRGTRAVVRAALGCALVLGVAACAQSSEDDEGSSAARDAELVDVAEYEVEADHVITEVKYEQVPPVGGPHNPLWLNCGIYDDLVPSENAVHSIEHGAVWITYDPALPDEQVELLKTQLPSTYVVLSPFEGLEAPVVASAWGRQLALEGVEDPRLGSFIKEYRQGGVAPEIGASCSGASDGTLPLDAIEQMN